MGTFPDKFGGSFAQIALNWLAWQLKGDKTKADVFLRNDLAAYPGWTLKTKNLKQ
jgi:hypothetical protein